MEFKKPEEWEYPKDWPPEKFMASHLDVTRKQLDELKRLIESDAGETDIANFLISNKGVLVNSLRSFSTGHHGAWIIPKQMVRPPLIESQKGLIPDYILGGKNSDGFSWYVLELKGANEKILTESNNSLYFGSVANKAIGQIIEYIDYCASAQSYLRDSLKLSNFREPKGFILIGREKEFSGDSRREKFKSAWNRFMGHKVEIRTYDSLLRWIVSVVEDKERKAAAGNTTNADW
jgi:hypothetical protein